MIQLSLFNLLLKSAAAAAIPKFISTDPKMLGRTSDQVQTALTKAESGGMTNPFTRHHAPEGVSSTAYGPLGITGGLAQDFMTNRNKMNWISPSVKPYLTNFVNQSEWFKAYGRNPELKGYHKNFDYGGPGYLTNAADKAQYNLMGKDMIRYNLNNAIKRKGNVVDQFLHNWRSRSEPIPLAYKNNFTDTLNTFKPVKTNTVPVVKPQVVIGR